MFFDIISNPVIISVLMLCILCLFKVNVLLAIIISSITAGIISGMNISTVMNTFITGMGANSETALSYILLGAFAAAMIHTGLAQLLSQKVLSFIKSKSYLLIFIITLMAIASQNLIPVHIAFIPIVIPPLLTVMNKLQIDRRAIACALAFGLKMPYIAIPAGFGLIFQGLIAENLTQNGINITTSHVWHYTWYLGLAMFFAFIISIFITYRKKRIYENISPIQNEETTKLTFNKNHYIVIAGALTTLIVQLITSSLPLGALLGLGIIFGAKAISHKKMDKLVNEGVVIMGYVAFVMLVAAGFALVLKQTGGIDSLVQSIMPFVENNKFLATLLMMIVGLFITMGVGTSFGTIPILAVLFVPICTNLELSIGATVIIIAAAAALGDAGSPASDTTLGPTSGLNVDGQHNHITDTCIPTFLHYNIALIIFALIAIFIF